MGALMTKQGDVEPTKRKKALKEKRKAKKVQEKAPPPTVVSVKEEPVSPAPPKKTPTTPRTNSKKAKTAEPKASTPTAKSNKKQRRKSSNTVIEDLPTGQLLAAPSTRPAESPLSQNKNGVECFKEVRVEYPIHLPPSYIGSPLSGVLRVLGEHLMRYSRELDGVPLSIGPPGLLQRSASIITDLPAIHFTVTVKLLVFSPPIGSKLVGVVHQIGFDYIALLVLGTFNASILSHDLPHFVRDVEKDCWRHNTTGQTIEEGTRILFTVQEINKSTDSYSIIGSMKDPSTGVLPGKVLKKKATEETDENEEIYEEDDALPQPVKMEEDDAPEVTSQEEVATEEEITVPSPKTVTVKEEPVTPSASDKKTKKRKRSSSGKDTPKKKKVKTLKA